MGTWKLKEGDLAAIQKIASTLKVYEGEYPQELSSQTILITGEEYSGKTHLSCTLALEKKFGPVYILDTELRAQRVARKFAGVKLIPITNYLEFVAAVEYIRGAHKGQPAVVILDSGTDAQKFSEEQYLKDVGKERMGLPITYPAMYSYLYHLLDLMKSSGFTIVFTSKMKDEFIGDQRTGGKLPRIFHDVPYRADIIITMDKESKTPCVLKMGDQDWPPTWFPKGTTLSGIIDAGFNNQRPEQPETPVNEQGSRKSGGDRLAQRKE